jgi:uncharacterized phage-associated protein
MLVNYDRNKLLNAIVFFALHTENCSKTKLFKLLFLLDFDHFKATGRSVTGLKYHALPMGPVPLETYSEFDEPREDFTAAVRIVLENFHGYPRQLVVAQQEFESDCFTRRERKLLEEISAKYRTQNATEMVEVTHAEGGVWDQVWNNKAGLGDEIPYELSLADLPSAAAIITASAERREFISLVSSKNLLAA